MRIETQNTVRIVAIVAAAIIVVTIGVILVASSSNSSYCEQYGTVPIPLSNYHFSPNDGVRAANGGDVAFLFNNWCTAIPASETSCACHWNLDNLTFTGADAEGLYEQNAIAHIRTMEDGESAPDIDVSFQFQHTVDITGWGAFLHEGSVMWIEFPDTTPTIADFVVTPGGLCVIENVDGGDGKVRTASLKGF